MFPTQQNEALFSEDNLENHLKNYFGYNAFRIHQKEIIEALMRKEDVLAILPTGAGKSICYQLPALLQSGTAIVISPLISLMQDQVCSLYKNDIPAAFLNSSLSYRDVQEVLQHLSDYKLIYVAPERFSDPQFIERLKNISISFFVIDEAHCISQWGHAFRVEYRKLSILKEHFPYCPIIALTATATTDVEKDIQTQLAMKQPTVIKGSFDRPNLTIHLQSKHRSDKQLQDFLEKQGNRSGIIYTSTRKGVETTFLRLKEAGYSIGRYHAGMTDQERSASQHAFLHDELTLMVATVAFGMGIHKPDIRFIVHLDMPRSIEQYYQEIGRAGRDGLPAECLMLYSGQDFIIYKSFLEELEDPALQKQMKMKTEQMYRLCTSPDCRRKELLKYFGESFPSSQCASCDNCLDAGEQVDITVIAQKILSCVFRLKQNVGIRMLIDVLRGSKNQNVLNRRYDQLSTYGLLSDLPDQEVRYYIDTLIHLRLIRVTEGEYPVLKWTEHSIAVVEGRQTVQAKKRLFKAPKEERVTKVRETSSLQYDEKLFEILRGLRTDTARQEQVPPFVVFSDRALQEMAVYYPQTQQEFSKINGVGPAKWVKYGEAFLEEIKRYTIPKGITEKQREQMPRERVQIAPLQRRSSMEETVRLYQEGHGLEHICQMRQLVKGTIITHLAEAIQNGIELDITSLVSLERQAAIRSVINEVGAEKLVPIKERLPEDFTFDEIRLIGAYYRKGN